MDDDADPSDARGTPRIALVVGGLFLLAAAGLVAILAAFRL